MSSEYPPHLCRCGTEAEEGWDYCSRECGVADAHEQLTAAERRSPTTLDAERIPSPVSERRGFFTQGHGLNIEPPLFLEAFQAQDIAGCPESLGATGSVETCLTGTTSVSSAKSLKSKKAEPTAPTAPLSIVKRFYPLLFRKRTLPRLEVCVDDDYTRMLPERTGDHMSRELTANFSIVGPEEWETDSLSLQQDRRTLSDNTWKVDNAQPPLATESESQRGLYSWEHTVTGSASSDTLLYRTTDGPSMSDSHHITMFSRLQKFSNRFLPRGRVARKQSSGSIPKVVIIYPVDYFPASPSPYASTSALLPAVTISPDDPSFSTVSPPAVEPVRRGPLDVPSSPTRSLSSCATCTTENLLALHADSKVEFMLKEWYESGASTSNTRYGTAATKLPSPEFVPHTKPPTHGLEARPMVPENSQPVYLVVHGEHPTVAHSKE